MKDQTELKRLVELARENLQQGKPAEALTLAEQAVQLNERFPPALFLLGVALRLTGSPQASIKTLTEFLALEPNVAQGRHEIGLAFNTCGQITNAIVELKKAVDLDPGLLGAWRMG